MFRTMNSFWEQQISLVWHHFKKRLLLTDMSHKGICPTHLLLALPLHSFQIWSKFVDCSITKGAFMLWHRDANRRVVICEKVQLTWGKTTWTESRTPNKYNTDCIYSRSSQLLLPCFSLWSISSIAKRIEIVKKLHANSGTRSFTTCARKATFVPYSGPNESTPTPSHHFNIHFNIILSRLPSLSF